MKKQIAFSLFAIGVAASSIARDNPNRRPPVVMASRASSCEPASERLFVEFNSVRALIETGGSMWQDRANGRASYEVPAGSNHFVIFSGALWMGGEDVNGQLKLAAHMFRNGNDFWAGPLGQLTNAGNYNPAAVQAADVELVRNNGAAETSPQECLRYDQFFTIRKNEVRNFIKWWKCENDPPENPKDCEGVVQPDKEVMDRILNWPAHGNTELGQDFYLAPFYDNDGDGFYDPIGGGDYPWYDLNEEVDCRNDRRVTLFGDETHWWVFNDKGNIHTETGGQPIGMEVRAQAFTFATDNAINDMTFYNYELINRGTQLLSNTYFGQWVDADIGNAFNDYVGCDVSRGLGFCFNGEVADDGGSNASPWNSLPPAIGVDFFEGPYKDNDNIDNPLTTNIAQAISQGGIPYSGLGLGYGDGIVDNERLGMNRFVYYNNSGGAIQGDPSNAVEYYQYLKGFWKNNQAFTYGGQGTSGTIETAYCFPGDSDPLHWGTKGVNPGGVWSEKGEGNEAGDRRFLQSAGPFTLRPGAVNNITVGVVYGINTNESDLEASVRTMKEADSKAQALFDNCFEIIEPPLAPDLTIQEMENQLILYLENPSGIDIESYFAVDRVNIITPDSLVQKGVFYDDTFRFEGYQIFQMIDKDATVSDIDDVEKARLVAQCDVKNGVGRLVNYTFDEALGLSIPKVMVNGEDEGIRRSFVVTSDQFATGDDRLVNHKKYYYIAVAYGYNNFKSFDANDPNALDGQRRPYIRSRISGAGAGIQSVVGIPHDPAPEADGTSFDGISYGYQPEITQIEGIGNGGTFVRLSKATQAAILAGNTVDRITYEAGAGPVGVEVVDPLNLAEGDYTLGFTDNFPTIDQEGWWLARSYTDDQGFQRSDTVFSNYTIADINEQLILEWGIAVNIRQQFYTGSGACQNKFTPPIGATITYADSSLAWLTGVADLDIDSPINWIRSGRNLKENNFNAEEACRAEEWIRSPCNYYDLDTLDSEELYEGLLRGVVAPFNRVGAGSYGLPIGFPEEDPTDHWLVNNQSFFAGPLAEARRNACFPRLHDVDIVLTADKDKWTRCPVIEINDDENKTEHGDDVMFMRSDSSVDKNGNPDGSGKGMGWFPGYAIDVTTGQRLNMVFAENSWLKGYRGNGADMLWNPTSVATIGGNEISYFTSISENASEDVDLENVTSFSALQEGILGGMHYVYVFGVDVGGNECPPYDEGAWLADKFQRNATNRAFNFQKAWSNCQWVWEPGLLRGQTLLATDAHLRLRINKPYENRLVQGENNGRPLYRFTIDKPTKVRDAKTLTSAIDNINIVPNPYYAYSAYETSKLDTRVKIVNLPERCSITIFNMQGALVRQFEKDDPLTSFDWDLKNHVNVPIAGGLYLVHIKVPITEADGSTTEQERILKWYGALRPPDLDNL